MSAAIHAATLPPPPSQIEAKVTRTPEEEAIEAKLAGASPAQLEVSGYERNKAGQIVPKAKSGGGPELPGEAGFERTTGLPGLLHLPGFQQLTELGAEGEQAVHKAVPNAGTAVAEGLVGLVKPIALRITLYAVLIFGGVAMLIYGIEQMLKPAGVDLKLPKPRAVPVPV